MSLLAAIRKLWHSVTPRTHSDVEEEFRSTLDAYQEDLIRQGLPEEEARRKARIDLGQPAAQNETYRAAIGLRLFDELGGDISLRTPRVAAQPWLRRRRRALTGARHRRHHGDVFTHLRRPAEPVSLRRRRPHHEPLRRRRQIS